MIQAYLYLLQLRPMSLCFGYAGTYSQNCCLVFSAVHFKISGVFCFYVLLNRSTAEDIAIVQPN